MQNAHGCDIIVMIIVIVIIIIVIVAGFVAATGRSLFAAVDIADTLLLGNLVRRFVQQYRLHADLFLLCTEHSAIRPPAQFQSLLEALINVRADLACGLFKLRHVDSKFQALQKAGRVTTSDKAHKSTQNRVSRKKKRLQHSL